MTNSHALNAIVLPTLPTHHVTTIPVHANVKKNIPDTTAENVPKDSLTFRNVIHVNVTITVHSTNNVLQQQMKMAKKPCANVKKTLPVHSVTNALTDISTFQNVSLVNVPISQAVLLSTPVIKKLVDVFVKTALKDLIVNYVQLNITTIHLASDALAVLLVSLNHSAMRIQLSWYVIALKDTLVLNVENVLKDFTPSQHVASAIVPLLVLNSIKLVNRYHVML